MRLLKFQVLFLSSRWSNLILFGQNSSLSHNKSYHPLVAILKIYCGMNQKVSTFLDTLDTNQSFDTSYLKHNLGHLFQFKTLCVRDNHLHHSLLMRSEKCCWLLLPKIPKDHSKVFLMWHVFVLFSKTILKITPYLGNQCPEKTCINCAHIL